MPETLSTDLLCLLAEKNGGMQVAKLRSATVRYTEEPPWRCIAIEEDRLR